jgi:hypothetical protein
MHKRYLGDGVYAEVTDAPVRGTIRLTTEDGRRATNTIVLEPEVLEAWGQYMAQVAQLAKEGRIP